MNEQAITVVIHETGDRKKGKKTDYVARQYLGSVGKVDNGKGTLNESDKYKTKIEFPSEIMTELMESGLNIELVLADS